MPDDRWGPERAQHDFDLRKKSDDRIQALEDDRGRVHGRGNQQNGNGIARFLWLLVTGLLSLFLLGVAGGIVMYRDMGEVKAILRDHGGWIDYFKQELQRERRR